MGDVQCLLFIKRFALLRADFCLKRGGGDFLERNFNFGELLPWLVRFWQESKYLNILFIMWCFLIFINLIKFLNRFTFCILIIHTLHPLTNHIFHYRLFKCSEWIWSKSPWCRSRYCRPSNQKHTEC